MFPLKRAGTAALIVALTACSGDQPITSIADPIAGTNSASSLSGTQGSVFLTSQYSLLVGQRLTIKPKTTYRSSRIKWTTSDSRIAGVNSQGTVTGNAAGNATVTVTGLGVNESYGIAVTSAAPPTVTSFSLQPLSGVSLLPGQTQQFSTAATWSDGKQYPLTVTYSATGGSITSSGLFTAGNAAGRFAVIAACLCGITDTTLVDVAQLTKLTISPKTLTSNPGASTMFDFTASWSTGATAKPPVTWSVDPIGAGSISQSGAYVAPSTPGNYRVIVKHSGGSVADTAFVSVSGGASPPPATPPAAPTSSSCSNEPTGYTLHGDLSFSSTTLPSTWGMYGADGSVNRLLGPNGSGSLAFTHEAGLSDGQIGELYTEGLKPLEPRKIYSCVVFRLDDFYQQHMSGTKFIYPFIQGPYGDGRPFHLGLNPIDSINSGKSRWRVEMYTMDPVKVREDNVTPQVIRNGRWYKLEMVAISNTVGVQNSVLQWWTSEWQNGSWSAPVLNGSYNDVIMSGGGNGAWVSWSYNLYFGGQGGPVLPVDQRIYINQLRVSYSK